MFNRLAIALVFAGMFGVVTAARAADREALYARTVVLPSQAFAHDSARACFDRLFILGGLGKRETERAAFLVYQEDGTFRCHVWPPTFTSRSESWRGLPPDGTAAIVHTHPNDQPAPSRGDHALAEAWGVPVLVITRSGVTSTASR